MDALKGRNRSIRTYDNIPDDIQPGDYWQIGDPEDPKVGIVITDEPSNLTQTSWMVAAPFPDGSYGLGTLRKHTVRLNDDNTISVLPGDGSSNSILVQRTTGQEFHGYIYNGVWKSV